MFAAFCSAGERTCKSNIVNLFIVYSIVLIIVVLMKKNGITWPGMARAVESLVAMARGGWSAGCWSRLG